MTDRSASPLPPTREAVEAALSTVCDPKTGRDIMAAGMISGLVVRDGHVGFALEVPREGAGAQEPLRKAAEKAAYGVPGVLSVTAVLTAHSDAATASSGAGGGNRATANRRAAAQGRPQGASGRIGVPGVAAIIAVASGKGGVGKSTVAVNLALALARLGRRVGLLDADIYGPSIPRMLGLTGKPETSDGKKLEPKEAYGIKAMSIGLLIDEDQPMIWRGPMVMTALTQLLGDVNWAPLDVLVVDMPPGTGDAQLTLAQRVPLTGAVVVSTPQEIALIDARKGLAMFRQTHVPVFGIIENMSYFVSPETGEKSFIFGEGGARRTAEKLGTDFLGEVPLFMKIRETSDAGTPIVATAPDSPEAAPFLAIAEKVGAALDEALGAGARQPPAIVFEE